MNYGEFIKTKQVHDIASGFEPDNLHPDLYDFQKDITAWAIRRGRAAIFADCGLGKTVMQLDVIERCLELWTAPGDTTFSPFAGIGSELYCAIKLGRKGIGIELKESYYNEAVRNLENAENAPQENLFSMSV